MITIILPVYNSISYIKDCLDSISKQSFKYWNLLIFDDGSTDGTLEYIENYIKKESRAKLYKRNHSYINNLNEGIELSNTKYIARMDSDDIMEINRLEKEFNFLETYNDIDLVSTNVKIIDENNNEKGTFGCLFGNCLLDARDLAFMNQIVHPSVLIRTKSIKDNNIRYREEYKFAEDWDMWTVMLEKGLKLYNIDDMLLKYRVHSDSMSRTNRVIIDKLKNKIINRLYKLF